MKSGSIWSVTLPNGKLVHAHVNCSEADEMVPSLYIVGGDLQGTGSFYLAKNSSANASEGTFIEYGNPEAWKGSLDESGQWRFVSEPVSSFTCLPPGTDSISAPYAPANTGGSGSLTAPVPPAFESRPGSANTYFVDFRGGTITIAGENEGKPIVYECPGLDVTVMEKIVKLVAEYYTSFDVNVTTIFDKYDQTPLFHRMRGIVAKHQINGSDAPGGIGGVAGLKLFREAGLTKPSNSVGWIFCNPQGLEESRIIIRTANSAAHEFGHTLGTAHWGSSFYTGNAGEYYTWGGLQTHGIGGDAWAPLMGNYHEASIVQWSKGDYQTAKRAAGGDSGDDLSIIANSLGGAGNAYVLDDKGNDLASAAVLHLTGGAPDDSGIINWEGDTDYFKFTSASIGELTFNVDTPGLSLDIEAVLLNSNGTPIASDATLNTRSASIHVSGQPAGTYYLRILAHAQGDPKNNGWSNYANIGSYRITGAITSTPPTIRATVPPEGLVGIPYSFFLDTINSPTTYYVTNGSLPPGLNISNDRIAGTPTAPGSYGFTLAVANGLVGSSKSFSITIRGDVGLPDALDSFGPNWTTTAPPSNITSQLWRGQHAKNHDGNDAARSGGIAANSDSILSTSLEGPGKLSFYYQRSCDPTDKLFVYMDFVVQMQSVEPVGVWTKVEINVPSGTHPVSLIYRKDASLTDLDDAVYVDQVTYLRTPQFPEGNFFAECTVGQNFGWKLQSSQPVTKWILTSGSLPPGVNLDPTTGALMGIPTATGVYDPVITAVNEAGSTTTSPTIYSFPDITLPVSCDSVGLVWTTDGFSKWVGDTSTTHDGVDAARSGPISHGLSTFMQTTVTGPGNLSFWWKCSTEENFDFVTFTIDGALAQQISGEVDWNQKNLSIGSGTHVLRWEYARNESGQGGSNAAWVDQLSYTTNGPQFTNPLAVTWTAGVTAQLQLTSSDASATFAVPGPFPDGVFYVPSLHLVGAVPKQTGVFYLPISATSSFGTNNSTLLITVESSYAAYARDHGLPTNNGYADPDDDGLPNFSEPALNLNPYVKNTFSPISRDPATGHLKATFQYINQIYADVRIQVEVSNDLIFWIPIARSEGGNFVNLGALSMTTQGASNPYTITIIDSAAAPLTTKRYMRMRFEQQ